MDNFKNIENHKKFAKIDARGIQTLFRTLLRNHYNLLKMVDNKAGIIITVNSVIISLLMGVLFIGATTDKGTIKITQIKFFIVCCVLSMTIAVISMLPYRYMGKQFKNSGYKGTLYAQNFSKMKLDDFRSSLYNIMESGYNLYDEMINDLYFLDRYITYKQNLVMVSFLVFLIGLIGMLVIE
ncbi:Pycsar system effector family protein [Tenacibaculum maritimum]|uniref:Pycsar system effector family protein n=1 Tax=Tenacibaculum maritimum TaxID=107401 RepID=UPI0038776937